MGTRELQPPACTNMNSRISHSFRLLNLYVAAGLFLLICLATPSSAQTNGPPGTVVAWGDDRLGQIEVPTNLNAVISVSANGGLSLALKSNGSVVGWGDN